MKNIIKCFVFLSLFFFYSPTQARDTITDWYLKDFQSNITVNKDSSVNIVENITADCGDLPDKHGIFRVLPTKMYIDANKSITTPISLNSITDFNNSPLKYSTLKNNVDNTLTWKIGDANKTVTSVNYYKIDYLEKNVIRFDNSKFDEFYWNLNGNFWDIQTDQYSAKITFPSEVNKNQSEVNLYSGDFKDNLNGLATFKWLDDHTIEVDSKQMLNPAEGITISITFPKGIFTPYKPTFWEVNWQYLSFLIPVLILLLCSNLWNKYGKDPKINPTIVPEFAIPDNLSPMKMGMILSDNNLKSQYISAAIINCAVKKALKIEKIEKKGIFGTDDYKLTKTAGKNLTNDEKILLDKIFASKTEIKLSDLKNKFYNDIPKISESITKKLVAEELILTRSRILQIVYIVIASVFFFSSFFVLILSGLLTTSFILTAIIIFVFSFLMKVRTQKGAEMVRKIRGFELYMRTAEKYRQQFNEKENIFERFLPYAIMFGITGLWIEKMKLIYGQEYFTRYHPIWFYGAGFASFDAHAFESTLNSMTSNMATTLSSNPSSSGAGGGGFSGGGGGGGGGGGW